MSSDDGSEEGAASAEHRNPTIVADDGRVLLFSYERFVDDIVHGDRCFVCGAERGTKVFNDEHIIPRWVLRRFDLFAKSITLPTGEKRTYDRYKVPCCKECNSLLGERLETPVSKLLDGDIDAVRSRLDGGGRELLFKWLALLFFKNHLKDVTVALHPDPRRSEGFIGEVHDWSALHHIHAVARSPYTGALLTPGVVGTLEVFEVDDGINADAFDYLTLSFSRVIMVRLGRIGIVAVLDDAELAARAWSHRLEAIDGPLSVLQLRELAAMFAVANDDLLDRPVFATLKADWALMILARVPGRARMADLDPERFGEALLFTLRDLVARRVIEVDGTSDPEEVAALIRIGRVRFLTDEEGRFRRNAG